MRKPRQDRQQGTRDRILDATLAIVQMHGIGDATTKRIAAQAGVSEGSLYNHFADKPELLTTLVLERLPSIRTIFAELQQHDGAAALSDRMVVALEAMIRFYAQAQPIVAGILSDPQLLALCRQRFADTDEGPHRAHEKLNAFLRQAQRAGQLKPDVKPAVLASLLIGACTEYASISHLTGKPPGGLSRTAYAKALVETVAAAFTQPPTKR